MTDINALEAELKREVGTPAKVLGRLAGLPAEAALLAAVLDCPATVPGGPADRERAWALVWLVLQIETGAPVWTSAMLGRIASQGLPAAGQGGPETLYRTLGQALRHVSVEPGAGMLHFLRDLGRACRTQAALVQQVPFAQPFAALESFALLYAPGVEHLPAAVHQEMLRASRGTLFADEVAQGLDFG